KEGYWSTRKILRAISSKGHEPEYVKTDEVRLVVGEPPDALHNGSYLRSSEVFIPRVGRSMTNFGTMLLRHLEIMHVPTTMSDEVLASMKRVAPHTEWRANIHLGAKGQKVELSDDTKAIAVRASRAVGLEVSGVDLIMNGDQPYVLEVNASPGFHGLLDATGVNAAGPIVDYAVEKAKAGR